MRAAVTTGIKRSVSGDPKNRREATDTNLLVRSIVTHSISLKARERLTRFQYDTDILRIAIDEAINSSQPSPAPTFGLSVQSLLEIIAQYAVFVERK